MQHLLKNGFEFVAFSGVLAVMCFWAEILGSFTS